MPLHATDKTDLMPESPQKISAEMRRNYRTSEALRSGTASAEPREVNDAPTKYISATSPYSKDNELKISPYITAIGLQEIIHNVSD